MQVYCNNLKKISLKIAFKQMKSRDFDFINIIFFLNQWIIIKKVNAPFVTKLNFNKKFNYSQNRTAIKICLIQPIKFG